jgi:hypothetical protein
MDRFKVEYKNEYTLRLFCLNIKSFGIIADRFTLLYQDGVDKAYFRSVEDFVDMYFCFCDDILITSLDEYCYLKYGYSYEFMSNDTELYDTLYDDLQNDLDITAQCIDNVLADKDLCMELLNRDMV